MRKLRFFVVLSLIMSVFALTSCSGTLGNDGKKVSEYRDEFLVGESAAFYAEAISGYRETPFEIDGKSGEKCDFFLVTLRPKDFDPTRQYKYKVSVGGVEYEGDFNKHPFENTYSFEVAARQSGNITVTVNGEEIELTSIKTEQYITAEKAFEIAKKRLSDSDIFKSSDCEIFIRLIPNPVNASGGYFWYVAFVDENSETSAVLIHPETMEIVAVRE